MKKVLLLLVILLVVGCNEEVCRPTAWSIAGTNLDASDNLVIGRVGLANTDGYEFGFQSGWDGKPGNTSENQTYGGYVMAELPLDPNGLIPYVGFNASVGDNDGSFYGFIGGTRLPITKTIDSVIEYQRLNYQGAQAVGRDENDEDRVLAGLRLKF